MSPALLTTGSSTELNGHSSTTNGHASAPLKPVSGFGTRAIHVGSEANAETGAVIPPISLSTTYKQDGVGNHKGFEYSRSGNPNRDALEQTLAAIEGGGATALAFASGSATTATMIQSLGPGAHIVSVNDVYGGTFRYMARVAKETQGVDTTFVDLQDADDEIILSAFRAETKLVWIESPTNPTLRIVDIPRIVRLAHSHPSQPLVIVDNTFLSPYYQSPLLLGADVVMHSMTKYINGHSDVVMGALVVPAHRSALAEKLRFLQNATGAVPSAFDCWLAQRGAKTLHLRMQAHGANAVAVARALEKSPHVDAVIYPGLPSHPRHAVARASLSPQARKYVNSGAWRSAISTSDDDSTSSDTDATADDSAFPYGGMISFRIRGGGAAAKRFLTATRLFTLAESLGGVESLAELPAEMTHGSIPAAEREALGITDNLIRLSVGVEDAEDLVADVERALEVALNKI